MPGGAAPTTNQRADTCEPWESSFDNRQHFGMSKQDDSAVVVQLIADLALAVCGIHRTSDGAELAGGIEAYFELGAIRQEQAESVAWPQPEPAQSARQPVRLALKIGKRETPALIYDTIAMRPGRARALARSISCSGTSG